MALLKHFFIFQNNKSFVFMSKVVVCFFVLATILFATQTDAAGPKHGGTLIIVLAGETANLNPATTGGSNVMPVIRNVCSQLLTLDWDMNPVPSLASSYKASEDGLTYTFNLVKNATWHDGKPFTSADVVCTMREIMPLHFRSGKIWKNVTVEAPDDYTVIMKLKQPFSPFIAAIASPSSAPQILPKHIYGGTDIRKNPYNSKPIGTGPFVFKKWVRGSHIELIKNKNYFARGPENKPYIDRIIFQLMPDPAARILALKKGELDFIYAMAMPVEYIPDLRKDPSITIDSQGFGALSMKWLWFNLRKPPFSNKLVRQAIAHAIDKQQILDLALRGTGRIATSIINTKMKWAYNPEAPDYPYDPKKANAMLDQAGYPRGADGIRFKKRLICIPGRGSDGRVVEVIRDQLKQVGIDAQIIGTDRASFVNTMFLNWDFDMAFQQGATSPDPTIGSTRFIATNMIKKAPYVNATGFSNSEVDKLLDLEFKEANKEKRAAMWHRIQEIFNEELPMLPIYEAPDVNVFRSEWVDMITTPDGASESRENVYKKSK